VRILLLGPQGSGKGTQAKRIAAEYDLPHVATGDMFRAAIAADTPLGREVKPILDEGRLVPDELTIALIRERLEQDDAPEGFVLDGFPRNLAQARALDALLRELGKELLVVFELQLDDATARERLRGRASEEGRVDDADEETMDRRLAIYHEQTEPVVTHYRARGILVGIHAGRTIDEVFAEIQRALDQAAVRLP
jgi:adenylate kinase